MPLLRAERFSPAGESPEMLFAVEGGIAVSDGLRVGLITDDGVTWVGKIPPSISGIGPNRVVSVRGRAPDMLAAVYWNTNPRVAMPTYFPLTRKAGGALRPGDGGVVSAITGVARVDDTMFVSAWSGAYDDRARVIPVGGPKLVRHLMRPREVGCAADAAEPAWGDERLASGRPPPALTPDVLESSSAGTMVSIGTLCGKRGPAAETWDRDGKTRIVELRRWWKHLGSGVALLKGEGDELWARNNPWDPVLHFQAGEFHPVALPRRPVSSIFVSPRGQLYASDGETIVRLEGDDWVPVWRLPEPSVSTFALDAKGALWASSGDAVYRLTPGPDAPAPGECRTPFVYLFEVSSEDPERYTFPATRKALAAFPGASALTLVEFKEGYDRRLGVEVTSWAQGEALAAFAQARMPDEHPRVFCFDPGHPRRIALDAQP